PDAQLRVGHARSTTVWLIQSVGGSLIHIRSAIACGKSLTGPWRGTANVDVLYSLPARDVREKEALHTDIYSVGCHQDQCQIAQDATDTSTIRDGIVSCSPTTTPGQSPLTPIFTPFSKLQGDLEEVTRKENSFYYKFVVGDFKAKIGIPEEEDSGMRTLRGHPDSFEDYRGLPRVPPTSRPSFIDYEKAFDCFETNAILSVLVDQGVDPSYMGTLTDCYRNCSTTVQLFHRPLNIPTSKSVDQATPCLQITFVLQWVMKSMEWNERGKRVDGRFLSNLRFEEGIVLFSRNITEAETMLKELNEVGKQMDCESTGRRLSHAFYENQEMELEGFPIAATRRINRRRRAA
ncbi:unnamed protein product, partial [Strongylus vulgaris]